MQLCKRFFALSLFAYLLIPCVAAAANPAAMEAKPVIAPVAPTFALPAPSQISNLPNGETTLPLDIPSLRPDADISPVPLPEISAPQTPLQKVEEEAGLKSRGVQEFLENVGPIQNAAPAASKKVGDDTFNKLRGNGFENVSATPVDPPARRAAAPAAQPNALQQHMLDTLQYIKNTYAGHDAPIPWKTAQFHFDLNAQYEKVVNAVLSNPNIKTPEFQDLMVAFVYSMRNYHDSLILNSTERARLPLIIFQAEGKYYILFIDAHQLPENIPFKVGDEVVEFDGKPTDQVVGELAAKLGGNMLATDMRLASLFLTNRRRARGDHVPQGDVSFKIRQEDGKIQEVRMPWDYTPEMVSPNVPLYDGSLAAPAPAPAPARRRKPAKVLPESGLDDSILPQAERIDVMGFIRRAFTNVSHPLADIFAQMRSESNENPFLIGARNSFIPILGEGGQTVWQTKNDDPFHAYIFETKDNRKVGFIRIPSYEGGAKEADRFGEIMAKFQKETDALVIDQFNNPGGSIFYLYALASHLTDKPLKTPHQRLIIGEKDAEQAGNLLLELTRPGQSRGSGLMAEPGEEENKQESADGYPITQKFMQLLAQFSQFVLKQFSLNGQRFTEPTWLWGVDDIDPAPKAEERYTKPILLLINELDFSGGDFFPAIMQDNQRVKIFGVNTAGAGGVVNPHEVENQLGIARFSTTGSLAIRANGQPIENLGVKPDIDYAFTAKDIRTGFAEARLKILKAIQGLMDSQPAEEKTQSAPPAQGDSQTVPAELWKDMATRLDSQGKLVSQQGAARMIQAFGLPPDSAIKGMAPIAELQPDGTAIIHAFSSYSYSDQNRPKVGYVFMAKGHGRSLLFFLGPSGQLTRSAEIIATPSGSQVVDASLQAEFEREIAFWMSNGSSDSQKPAPMS